MLLWLVALVAAADAEPITKTWTIEGTERFALLYLPRRTSSEAAPVVFGFHGHGGTAYSAARSFQLQGHWPEALVVYLQGLPTPGRLTDPEGKRNGWQHDLGEQHDRDLKFFDAVLQTLKTEYRIDEDRIYAMGHSNGGGFTYLLWASRPNVLAAVAPSAAGSRRVLQLKPKPAMHIAGENDPLVKFAVQQRVMEAVRRVNRCEATGQPWAPGCTLYPSPPGTPFVAYIHAGAHKFPEEAPALIVKFFQQQRRQAGPADPPSASDTPEK